MSDTEKEEEKVMHNETTEKDSESESDSDASIETEDLNNLNETINNTFDKPIKVEPKIKPKKKVSQATLDALKRGREKATANRLAKKNVKTTRKKELEELKKKKEDEVYETAKKKIEEGEDIMIVKKDNKKAKGRPPKPIEEKLAKQIIHKEKIIYMIPDDNGNFIQHDPTKMKVREMKKLITEKEVQEEEQKLGKALLRNKNGKARKPYVMTEARKAAIERLKAGQKKKLEEKKGIKKEKEEKQEQVIKEAVDKSIKEVVSQPAPKRVKSATEIFNEVFG
jgi:hypothetical protein